MGIEKVVIVNKNIVSSKNFYDTFTLNPFDSVFFSCNAVEAKDFLLSTNPKVIDFYGGDGTFSATLNKVLSEKKDFLEDKLVRIVPLGTGNDRYTSLVNHKNKVKDKNKDFGLSVIIDDYLKATINEVHNVFIFNVGGIGLDSQALIEYESLRNSKIPSSLKYFWSSFKAIHKLNGYLGKMNYESGLGERKSFESALFLFMLGSQFGDGMPINKKFVMDDGKFEVASINRGSHFALYKALMAISVFKMSQYNNPLIDYLEPTHGASLEIMGEDNFYFESDGELLTCNEKIVPVNNIKVEVVGKINYLV